MIVQHILLFAFLVGLAFGALGRPRSNLEPKRQSRTDVPEKVLGVLEGVAGRILGRQGAPLGRNNGLEQ